MSFAFAMYHGRLVDDPQERDYKNREGKAGKMTTFAVAVDARFGDKTYYHDCTAFGQTAEAIAVHFHKGQEICVYGEPTYNVKEDKETGKKMKFETLNVDRFDFCGTKADNGNGDTFEKVNDDTPF